MRPRAGSPAPRDDACTGAGGRKDGFEEEALPFLDAVFGFALHLTRGDRPTAEDLVQETFLRAHRFWDRYERGTNVRAWLFTICRNAHRHADARRRRRREIPTSDFAVRPGSRAAVDLGGTGVAQGGPGSAPAPASNGAGRGEPLTPPVVAAIGALPDRYRDVLVLSDLGDLRYEEIAEVLNVPLGTVKSRLSRARRILREAPGILEARREWRGAAAEG
ncbi:MAG: sigma factor-like helix-turn-helix DNA-binding protein [Gemmatimonadota bacterium]|nr:sigma factor-like helix-turn-helix DNA-binding protein [Gemmatimonadota bacterium]